MSGHSFLFLRPSGRGLLCGKLGKNRDTRNPGKNQGKTSIKSVWLILYGE